MFVYQPTFITLELKVNESTEHTIGWKSKGLYNFFHYMMLSYLT